MGRASWGSGGRQAREAGDGAYAAVRQATTSSGGRRAARYAESTLIIGQLPSCFALGPTPLPPVPQEAVPLAPPIVTPPTAGGRQ
jgi:hypothetical protein